MPTTNAPRIFATASGNVSVETEIIDSQRRQRQIPIVDVRVTVLPGTVKSPNILFKFALEEGYAAATHFMGLPVKPETDTVRMLIKHNELQSHNHIWSSSTFVIGHGAALNEILQNWENAMQSGEEVDLSNGAIEFIIQYTLTREHEPAVNRVGAGEYVYGARYAARKDKMYNRISLNDIFEKDNTLLNIPHTMEKICFPMAFLSSQCRYFEKNASGTILEIIESGSQLKGSYIKNKKPNLFIACPPHLLCLQVFFPCFYFENQICLFNCYKIDLKKLSPSHLTVWIQLCQYIHHYVETILQHVVDMNNLEEVCNAYCEVFDVIIHIRRMELQGERVHYYFHQNTNLAERHVTIMLTNHNDEYDHCYSFLDIRKFVKSNESADRVNIVGYCDYCGKVKSSANESRAKSFLHLNDCRHNFFNRKISSFNISESLEAHKHFMYDNKKKEYKCNLCFETMQHHSQLNFHRCYSPILDLKDPIDENKIFVFDLEATQKQLEDDQCLYIHNCNLVCIRSVYNNAYRGCFATVSEFMEELLSDPIFRGSTILAHNGGAYDCKFILQYLEHNLIDYDILPRPGSIHKYLSLTIRGKSKKEHIVFKDFMMFVSGSLKSIAEGFKLEISKGDFPHRFNIPENEHYIGSIPPLESAEDYFCIQQKKSKKEVDEIKQWYEQQMQIYCTCYQNPCSCNKLPWNLQQQLRTYCWLDVDVLAAIVKKFRDTHLNFGNDVSSINNWKPVSIDPFNFCTQSQVAMNFFLAGKQPNTTAAISTIKHRSNFSAISIIWLEFMSKKLNIPIQHIGNSEKEYYDHYTRRYLDGFSKFGNKVFQFHGCFYHGCSKCFDADQMHPTKHVPYGVLYNKTIEHGNELKKHYKPHNYYEIWECEFNEQYQKTQYDKDLANIILDREELFYGGRTEVFAPYANDTVNDKIEYHDVCSLYPTVCTHDVLPTGFPTRYFGENAQQQLPRLNPNHENPIYGFVRCHIWPNQRCRLGLLPEHKDKKLVFDLLPKKGTWFSEEIYLAMSQGYEVLQIYEILDFDHLNRSCNYMKGYMSFFLRMKQEAEGWKKANASSDNPTEDEKEKCIDDLYTLNGNVARMRKELVQKNDVQRQIAKIYLNCLWGKFAQSSVDAKNMNIYGYHEFFKIRYDANIKLESLRFRHIKGEAYQVVYEKTKENFRLNRNYNIWIAAAVTAHARCRLHRQMIKIGPERVLYCDTDSIVFLYPRNQNSLASRGLGNWVDETNDFGGSIKKLYAFAPKSYCLLLDNGQYRIKAKGCRMTLSNKLKANPDVLEKMLILKCIETAQGYIQQEPLLLDHFTIFSNVLDLTFPYGTMFSRYCTKKLDIVISKRLLIPLLTSNDILINQELFIDTHPLIHFGRIDTVPFGFIE